jgi:hypothetical protein
LEKDRETCASARIGPLICLNPELRFRGAMK